MQEMTIQTALDEHAKAELHRRESEVVQNRDIVTRIVNTVMFLGRHGRPLRGHKESLSEDRNSGNFLEALKYLGQA